MKLFDKFLKAIGFEDGDEKVEEKVQQREDGEKKREKKQEIPVAKFNLKESKPEHNVYFPESQDEIEDVARYFVKGEDVSVDFSKFSDEDRAHALDFLSGAAFALGGQVKKTGESVYLLKH